MSAGTSEPPPSQMASRRTRRLIAGAVVIAALLGIAVLADDYGQSWDDHLDAQFGTASLRAYLGDPAFLQGGDRLYYGPLAWMIAQATVWLATWINPRVLEADVRHAVTAGFFLVACLATFWLARRLTGRVSAALAATLLFAFQPVLFGHAFINQKDIPFLSLFVLSVATGVAAVDSALGAAGSSLALPLPIWTSEWRLTRRRAVVALLGGVSIVALLANGGVYRLLTSLLALAYSQRAPAWINRLFQAAAEDAFKTPLTLYVEKLGLVYSWTSVVLALVILAVTLRMLGLKGGGAPSPAGSRSTRSLATFAAAGVVLGACLSIRILGAFAGALVILYALLQLRQASLGRLGIFLATAAVVCYLTWPFLWGSPIRALLEAVRLFFDFPPHIVLFNQVHYASTKLPRVYLPALLTIQLTETALLAALAGIVIAVSRLSRRHPTRRLLTITMIWLVGPLGYVVLATPSIYGNFRQFLFLLPSVFLFASLAIDALFNRIRRMPGQVAIGALLILPGLWGIFQLHPYEYIYYNRLIGGTQGATGRFPLDYWCTSSRAAMEYVNGQAEPGALVAVKDPLYPARTFARSDLQVVLAPSDQPPDFAVACDEQEFMDRFYPEMTTVHVVSVDGAPLAEIKRPAEAPGGAP